MLSILTNYLKLSYLNIKMNTSYIYFFQPLFRKIFLICFLFFFTSYHISFANAATSLLDYHFCENHGDNDGDGEKDKVTFIDNVMYINGKPATAEEIIAYNKKKLQKYSGQTGTQNAEHTEKTTTQEHHIHRQLLSSQLCRRR